MGMRDSHGAAGNKARQSLQAAMVTDSHQRRRQAPERCSRQANHRYTPIRSPALSPPGGSNCAGGGPAHSCSSFTPSLSGLGPAGSYWPRSGVCVSTQASTCGEYCFTKAAVSPGLSSAPGVVCAPQ